MKHTKGPWKYVKSTSYHSIQAEGPCDIARLVNSNREANAHLVSAAPEMLELVEILLNMTVNAVDPEGFSDIRNKCYQVLAKAKGLE
jgi:hypothetical protein